MTPAQHNAEFEAFCRAEYERWRRLPGNGTGAMMVWNPNWWWDRVEEQGRKWAAHIDPIAVDWWRQRGYRFFYENGDAHIELFEMEKSAIPSV